MTRATDVDTALRSLDPADSHVDPASARARADLLAILATDPVQAPWPAGGRGRPRAPRRTGLRVTLAVGAVAAATAVLVGMPALTGGDQAFASWTPNPVGMSAQERAAAGADCRRMQQDGPGAGYADDLRAAQTVVAERRGVWTTVVLAGADGFSALCISDDSTHLFKDMIGSIGRPTGHASPAPRDLTATDLGVGTMKAGDVSMAGGFAGSDVVGAVYHSPAHGDVAVTVSGGRFAFWLPGDELVAAPSEGVEVEVTYRDGTTGTTRLTL